MEETQKVIFTDKVKALVNSMLQIKNLRWILEVSTDPKSIQEAKILGYLFKIHLEQIRR